MASGGALLLAARTDPPAAAKGEAPTAPVPVVIAEVKRGNIDVFLTGLGAVTPITLVTVKSRVDGQLLRVNFQEGQIVAKGFLLAEIDARPFEAQLLLAEGQMKRDQALLENARRDLLRYQVLATQDSIARQQYDTQRSLVQQDEGNVKTDQANIDTAKLQIIYSQITAPVTGRVGLRIVDPGNIIHATDTTGLVDLAQVRPISVIFTIAQDALPPVFEKLRLGEQPVVDAFNRDLSQKLATGTLLTMDNQIDPTTGTVKLKAIFDNDDDQLFPNQFVNARLHLDVVRDAVVVPAAAVQRGQQRSFVYVVRADRTAEVRNVKLGPSQGDQIAVESGLSVGENVVVDGADRLREGARTSAQPAPDGGLEGGPL
jgi:multidrug efflux system membrane fusion protein